MILSLTSAKYPLSSNWNPLHINHLNIKFISEKRIKLTLVYVVANWSSILYISCSVRQLGLCSCSTYLLAYLWRKKELKRTISFQWKNENSKGNWNEWKNCYRMTVRCTLYAPCSVVHSSVRKSILTLLWITEINWKKINFKGIPSRLKPNSSAFPITNSFAANSLAIQNSLLFSKNSHNSFAKQMMMSE